jgi:plasmid stabilization system protein ParE
MARQVIWSEPAWEDLEAAAEYIGRDSESYAAAQQPDPIPGNRACRQGLGVRDYAHRPGAIPF